MLNKAILCGRLTKTPELTVTPAGLNVVRFTLAVDRRFKRQGEEKQTDFLNIVAFGKTAEFVSKYFEKGSAIIVCGSIQSRTYEKDGQTRYVTEIVADEVSFAGSKKESGSAIPGDSEPDPMAGLITAAAQEGFEPLDNDDDLPF